ncbi:MAG TPA: hypothetical protein VD902_19230 [Symbiobacteriaceae bacterium]|nr:hypothetical protein [Symbiobacteriaceae bacterium]
MKAWFPSLLMVIMAAFLWSGPMQHHWFGTGRDLVENLDRAAAAAVTGDWLTAGALTRQTQQRWESLRWRFSLSAGLVELKDFETELADLEGAVEARDAAQVRLSHRRALVLWHDLTSS